ncbi:aldolase [Acuticoccus kandeliae]|uniref:aldolase n=1 Tax=Acuticoccus kandeliae TaxID=2073160 RepID=UPI000D3EBD64|nr:aldolase [Acuticoccus kandeliae]
MTTEATDIATLREDLATAFRVAAFMDLNEGICNHFSVVVPGDEERYLINPYGVHWSEMRPEDLVLIDGDGLVIEGEGEVEATARNLHIAAHRANPRHAAVMHTHMPHCTALTMLQGGRLEMAHQTACRYHGRVIYIEEFGGLALDAEEGEAIATSAKSDNLSDVFFLAHHGVTVCGATVAEAFDDLYYLERAARQQILAQSTGLPLKLMTKDQIEHTARQIRQVMKVQAEEHFVVLKRLHPAPARS